MIKSIVAATREIDDTEAAVSEILSALNISENLLGNSLGIISCFSEFEDTGVLEAVCKALPFDCIGATTCICSTDNEVAQLLFAITVLTSDDCEFKALAVPVEENYTESISSGLRELLDLRSEVPALLLSYFPLINSVSGDMMLSAIDKVTGGVPLFGTMAVDHNADYSTAKTILNGTGHRRHLVFGAIYGNPVAAFEIAALDESKIRNQKAIITQSDGNILIGVNGKTALEYLEEIGLTKTELESGLGIIPLVVNHNDGAKAVARAVFALTPEGYAVCGGAMPEGATLALGHVDAQTVLYTTESTLKPFVKPGSVILSYSCMARFLCLGAYNTAEAERVSEVSGDTHYMFACSGGEICPLQDGDGNLKNYFHNYTNVFCRLT